MIINILNKEGLNTSSIQDLMLKSEISNEKLIIKILKICEDQNLIVRINQSIFISCANLDLLKEKLIIFFKSNSSISVSEFKNLFNISRKYAIPMLEYLDKIKFTHRNENVRELVQ